MNDHTPPRLFAWLLHSVSDWSIRTSALGDFEEIYREIARDEGVRSARRWYRRQALRSLSPLLFGLVGWKLVLARSYVVSSVRSMARQKGYTAINLAGLAAGMAAGLLILLFVRHELSYDRYHEAADRTHRVTFSARFGADDFTPSGLSAPMAQALRDDFADVETVTRLFVPNRRVVQLRTGDVSLAERNLLFADSTFFDVFSIPLLAGDPQTALVAPNSIVLGRDAARRYFGDRDPMGQVLTMDGAADYVVTGLFDAVPANTHFRADLLASLSSIPEQSEHPGWLNDISFPTYVVLREGADPEAFAAGLPAFAERRMPSAVEQYGARYDVQALTDIHLTSHLDYELSPNGDRRQVAVFALIAAFILLIAYVNYVNLSTARSATRMREIGIRKVAGSDRSQLVSQFLSESILLGLGALVVAVGMAALLVPFFSGLVGRTLEIGSLFEPGLVVAVVGTVTVLGALAGFYPAVFLSGTSPVAVLSAARGARTASPSLRRALVVFQFAISVVLIVGAIVVFRQLRFVHTSNLGFDREQVLVVQETSVLGDRIQAFRDRVAQDPAVVAASVSGFLPVTSRRREDVLFVEGRYEENGSVMSRWTVDHDYVRTMGMEIVAGRDFSRDFASDSTAVLVNEAAVSYFEWDDPIGRHLRKQVRAGPDGWVDYTVIGVVRDFHFESLRHEVGPMMLHLGNSRDRVSVRLRTADAREAIARIETLWDEMGTGQRFDYGFMDEQFDTMYRAEVRLGEAMGAFALLAVLIGCLGLFGLAAFSAESRRREMAIRKILGSSSGSVMMLLTREAVILVVLANLIAVPVAWFALNAWLDGYAFRTTIGVGTFLMAALLSFLVAAATTGHQALRAARTPPIVRV